MKQILFCLIGFVLFTLTACEITQEITLKENGTGEYTEINDMSSTITMAKQFAPQQASDSKNVDTVISLSSFVDSIKTLTPAQKDIIKKGSWAIKLNMDDEKCITTLKFPFEKPEQISLFTKAVNGVLQKGMIDKVGQAGSAPPPGMDQMPEQTSFDDYYTLTVTNGVIEKKLNKEKHANVESDEYFKNLKQASGMGASVTAKYIINLPRPATKVEGKGVKLSEDKKKVTIAVSSDDFFDDPSKLEYRVEY